MWIEHRLRKAYLTYCLRLLVDRRLPWWTFEGISVVLSLSDWLHLASNSGRGLRPLPPVAFGFSGLPFGGLGASNLAPRDTILALLVRSGKPF